jgi:hypothetical protein
MRSPFFANPGCPRGRPPIRDVVQELRWLQAEKLVSTSGRRSLGQRALRIGKAQWYAEEDVQRPLASRPTCPIPAQVSVGGGYRRQGPGNARLALGSLKTGEWR